MSRNRFTSLIKAASAPTTETQSMKRKTTHINKAEKKDTSDFGFDLEDEDIYDKDSKEPMSMKSVMTKFENTQFRNFIYDNFIANDEASIVASYHQ